MDRSLLLAAALFFAAPLLQGESSYILEKAEGADIFSAGPVKISSYPEGALIALDGIYTGYTPWELESMVPGLRTFTISAPGYTDLTVPLELETGKSYRLHANLSRAGGFLDLRLPAEGILSVDGKEIPPVKENLYSLPSGPFRGRLTVFGFEPADIEVTIRAGEVVKAEPVLIPTPFRLTKISLWPRVFNPENPGALGTLRLTLEATGPGTPELTVTDLRGQVLAALPPQSFDSWTLVQDITPWVRELPEGPLILKAAAQNQEIRTEIVKNRDFDLTLGSPGLSLSPVLPFTVLRLRSSAGFFTPDLLAWRWATSAELGLGGGWELSAGGTLGALSGAEGKVRGLWTAGAWGVCLELTGRTRDGNLPGGEVSGALLWTAEPFRLGLGGGAFRDSFQDFRPDVPLDGLWGFVRGEGLWDWGDQSLGTAWTLLLPDLSVTGSANWRSLLPQSGAFWGLGLRGTLSPGGTLTAGGEAEMGFFL